MILDGVAQLFKRENLPTLFISIDLTMLAMWQFYL
jgi:hypothetical protein